MARGEPETSWGSIREQVGELGIWAALCAISAGALLFVRTIPTVAVPLLALIGIGVTTMGYLTARRFRRSIRVGCRSWATSAWRWAEGGEARMVELGGGRSQGSVGWKVGRPQPRRVDLLAHRDVAQVVQGSRPGRGQAGGTSRDSRGTCRGRHQLRSGPPDRLGRGAGTRGQARRSGQQTTAGQLQRVVRAYRKVTALGEIGDANRTHERRYLDYYFLEDCFELRGRLTNEDGAVVAKALDRAKDKLFRSPPREVPIPAESQPAWDSPGQLRADALRDLAESWLDDHKVSGRTNSYEVVVHVDADALSEDAPGGRCEIDGAGAIAPETARRLTCDSGGTGRVRRRTVLDR